MSKKHVDRAHAKLSASGAEKWINCTPSAQLEEQFPKSESTYADEGTLAHELAETQLHYELGLMSEMDYKNKISAIETNILFKAEMYKHVRTHLNYVFERYSEARVLTPSAVISIEEKVNLTAYIEDGFGTCDVNIIADGFLEIVDLKYGQGVKVDAENNSQLKLYALGAFMAHELSFDIHTIILTIVQPRLNHISSWEISLDDLLLWGSEVVRKKAKMAFAGEGEQHAGPWCKWCRAKPKCRAIADMNLEMAKLEFQDPRLLTDSEILKVYQQIELLTDWASEVKDYVFKQAVAGRKWPGYKLVEGKSNRSWVDQDLVIDTLLVNGYREDQIQKNTVKGIGDIEDLMSVDKFNKILGHLIHKPKGKPTLVDEKDKRPVFSEGSAKEDFA